MTIPSILTPKAWINTLVLAGMGLLACAGTLQAQGRYASPIDRYAGEPSFDDSYVGDEYFDDNGYLDQQVAPAANFDQVWEGEPVAAYDSCDSCDSCDGCGNQCGTCCCRPWWSHRTGIFAEYMSLRPGSADQIFTIEQNDVVPGSFPTGPVGRVNVDSQGAYKVGFSLCHTDCSSVVASYTRFESSTTDTITAAQGNVLVSQLIHPSTITTGSTTLQSSANYDIDFQLSDLAYRHIWKACDRYVINWSAGFRYGQMEQDLLGLQQLSTAVGLYNVRTDVDFDGFGMTLGLDGERRSTHHGLMCYGRGLTSLLAGNWNGSYVQTNQFGGGVVANQYEDYRVTPVLELEIGLGWRSPCGRCRASAGYLTSAWYNSVSTREYVQAVRSNNYVSVDDTMTFSGLTTRFEVNF